MLIRSLALASAGVMLAAMPASAATTRIAMGDDYFSPSVKRVANGTRVVWVNVGDDDHTVTANDGYHRVLNPGERTSRVARRSFSYVCAYHDEMTGRVIVRR